MDAIIVGRALGTEALASVGASSPILNLVNGFFLGIASGATVILSQGYGAGDRDRVNKTLHTAMALALTLGVVITVVGILMAPQVLTLIGTPENCMEDAVTYSRWPFCSLVIQFPGIFSGTEDAPVKRHTNNKI